MQEKRNTIAEEIAILGESAWGIRLLVGLISVRQWVTLSFVKPEFKTLLFDL
jgi:hypothetical protein